MSDITITYPQFKSINERLAKTLTYKELFKAIRKPLAEHFRDNPDALNSIEQALDNQNKPHKALTGEWLANAIADKDYNSFIAALKNQPIIESQHNAPDFSAIQACIIDTIKQRHQLGISSDAHEVFAVCAHILKHIYPDYNWNINMSFSIRGGVQKTIPGVFPELQIYWVKPITININGGDHLFYTIKYKLNKIHTSKNTPTEDEIENEDLEMYTEGEMKHTFAWNFARKMPALTYVGNTQVLIGN